MIEARAVVWLNCAERVVAINSSRVGNSESELDIRSGLAAPEFSNSESHILVLV